jgi:hypothetical protein
MLAIVEASMFAFPLSQGVPLIVPATMTSPTYTPSSFSRCASNPTSLCFAALDISINIDDCLVFSPLVLVARHLSLVRRLSMAWRSFFSGLLTNPCGCFRVIHDRPVGRSM